MDKNTEIALPIGFHKLHKDKLFNFTLNRWHSIGYAKLEDHFIPIRMHKRQLEALVNANSVTDRVFTQKDQAQHHCQIGNIKLALDTMVSWIEQKT